VRESMDFKVKALQAEKFVEVLEEKIKELEKLIEELQGIGNSMKF